VVCGKHFEQGKAVLADRSINERSSENWTIRAEPMPRVIGSGKCHGWVESLGAGEKSGGVGMVLSAEEEINSSRNLRR